MRRLLLALLALIAAAIALPPLWFALFPVKVPALPAPEKRVALSSGARMHVIERGTGPAVVLVHGLPGQAGDWRMTSDLLAAHGRRVLAIDRIGYGHSDARRDDDYTLDANARELLELLAAEDLTDATVVGWSYGGATALVSARQDASRIGRLVLVGSAGPGIEEGGPPGGIMGLLASAVLSWVHAVPPAGVAVQRMISAAAYSGQPQPDWWSSSLAANMVQAKTFRAFQREGARMLEKSPPDSAGLALPILVIHGDQDRLAPIEIGRALARNNSSAELVEVRGGSHMLPVTHAALLADRIASFSTPPAAPAEPDAAAPEDSPETWTEALAGRFSARGAR